MNKSNLTNWLSALCAILLIVLLVQQSKHKNQLEEEVKQKTARITDAIQQQTAATYHALGMVIPDELLKSQIKKLATFEARIADTNSWPKDSTKAGAMVTELRELVRQMPPWAEEDLLPRLNAVRWGISALALVIKAQAMTGEELGNVFDDIDTAIGAKPDGASELIAKQLIDTQSKLKVKIDAYRRETAIADAELALKDASSPAEFSEILERLSEWDAVLDTKEKERVQKLQHDIRARVLSDGISNFVASVNARLSQATNGPSAMIRQISLGKLLDSVVSQQQSFLENSDADVKLGRSLTELTARIEKAIEAEGKSQEVKQEKKLREYQRWALENIKSFNVYFEKARSRTKPMFSGDVKKGAGVGASVAGGIGAAVGAAAQKINPDVSDPDYPAIEKAMTNYLTPISVGLLDAAVARLYSDAFEKGWKQLDGANQKYLQTEVAKQEAVVEKKKP